MPRWPIVSCCGSAVLVIEPVATVSVSLALLVTTRSSGLSGASGSVLPSLSELPVAVAVLVYVVPPTAAGDTVTV